MADEKIAKLTLNDMKKGDKFRILFDEPLQHTEAVQRIYAWMRKEETFGGICQIHTRPGLSCICDKEADRVVFVTNQREKTINFNAYTVVEKINNKKENKMADETTEKQYPKFVAVLGDMWHSVSKAQTMDELNAEIEEVALEHNIQDDDAFSIYELKKVVKTEIKVETTEVFSPGKKATKKKTSKKKEKK